MREPRVAERYILDETLYGPDYVHVSTFGSPCRSSLPVKLIDADEFYALTTAEGRFAGIKTAVEFTNAEMYTYLRLGVTSQSAMALKFLGYPTPESLTEDPETSALLPDVLARRPYAFPLDFINRCEEQGVSAMQCQLALRRGVTDKHMEGPLTVPQLVHAFKVFTSKNAPQSSDPNRNLTALDYVCDGTIPFEVVSGHNIPPGCIVAVGKAFSKNPDAEYVKMLRSDPDRLRRFTSAIRTNEPKASGVKELLALMDAHGDEVLDLNNPYLCATKVPDGEDGWRQIGLGTVRFMETIIEDEWGEGAVQHIYPYRDSLQLPGCSMTFSEVDRMFHAGITPDAVRMHVINGGVTAESLIVGHADGIESVLMSGVL